MPRRSDQYARECVLVRRPLPSERAIAGAKRGDRQERLARMATLMLQAADSDDPDRAELIEKISTLAVETAEAYEYADRDDWRPSRPTTPPPMSQLKGPITKVWTPWVLSEEFIEQFA